MSILSFAITTALFMCANTQLESASADKRSIVSITKDGVIDYEGQIKEGLCIRIRGDIGSSRPIYEIIFYYDNGLEYSLSLYFPANIDNVTPSAIQWDADFLNIIDELGRIILSINYSIIEQLKVEPYPANFIEYENIRKKCLAEEIESDVINEIVSKLQTKQLSQKETRDELEKFIAELFHVLSLDRKDERTHTEVWDNSYHIEFLNDDMMIVCYSKDASYMRISPTGKVRFQPFIIPFDTNFLRILWPM